MSAGIMPSRCRTCESCSRNLASGAHDPLLQSGNLVFRCDARTGVDLESMLEMEAEKRLGLRADFLIRSGKGMAEGRRAQSISERSRARPEPSGGDVPEERRERERREGDSGGDSGFGDNSRRRQAFVYCLPGRYRQIAADECAPRKKARHSRNGSELEHSSETRGVCRREN